MDSLNCIKRFHRRERGTTTLFYSFLVLAGAVGTDIRTECTNDKIRLSHPQLADPIQEKSYKELIWTVDDPEKQGQDKQKLLYCDEHFKCHEYNITGRYQQRIETTAAVRGVLYIKQKKFNDKLTYTCRMIQKGNKPPCDYTITVRSSANCLSTTVGKSIDLSRPIHGKFSKNDMEDISWYRILQDGGKEKIAHCSPSRVLCALINCTRSCPEYLTRLKTNRLSVILTNVTPNDRGLKFQCELHPGIHGTRQAYTIKVREVAVPREGTPTRTPEVTTGGSLLEDESNRTKRLPTISPNVTPVTLKLTKTLLFLCLMSEIFTFPG